MLALVILGIFLGYVAIAVLATVAAVRLARAKGLSRRKRWLSGAAVALVFYLIPFWDWIPTVAAHRYYCAKEAKFDLHKTIDQWKAENADILGSLQRNPRAEFIKFGDYEGYQLNQRLASVRIYKTQVFLSVARREGRIIDMKNGEVLASWIDFRTGYAPLSVGGEGAWKFWLANDACDETPHGNWAKFERFEQLIQQLGGTGK